MMQQDSIKGSTIYILIAGIIILATAAYSFLQYGLMNDYMKATADNATRRNSVAAVLSKRTDEFRTFAVAQSEKQKSLARNISEILPPNENYTELTRLFDEFFAKNDARENKIFQSSLRYGNGAPAKGMPGIYALPISMNIEGTRDNFFKFLNFINDSGTVDTARRLMAVDSIQLNFPDGGEVVGNAKQMINFTVEMIAYYQTPKIRK